MDYVESIEKSLKAFREFIDNINDYLPDTVNGEDYYFQWNMEDANYCKNQIDIMIDSVLSTKMANHVTYEFTEIHRAYENAFKNKNIRECQRILNRAVHQVCLTGNALISVKKQFKVEQ